MGLRDAALSEKLQMDPGLTLEKAVTSARRKEAVRKQQPLLRGDTKETKPLSEDPLPNVDVVKKSTGPGLGTQINDLSPKSEEAHSTMLQMWPTIPERSPMSSNQCKLPQMQSSRPLAGSLPIFLPSTGGTV